MATSGEVRLILLSLLVGSALGYSQPALGGELPERWRAALREGRVPVPEGTRMVPFTVAADASQFFAAWYSPSWSGVVAVATRSGAITRIRRFGNPDVDQAASGSFDGRYLAWVELHSRRDWNDWTLRAWDSRTRQVFDVARAPRLHGATVQGPLVIPEVSGGELAWVQANAAGQGEVHLYSLARRRDRVLSSGTAAPPVAFWGRNLLWQEIDVPGQLGHLAMASVADGKRVPVPEPLASIRHLAYLSANEEWVAWGDGASVWAWRAGGEPSPRLVSHGAERPEFLSLAGDLVSWDGPEGPVVADLRTGGMARLTERYGGRFARGKAVLVYQPAASEPGPGTPLRITVVDGSSLPAIVPPA